MAMTPEERERRRQERREAEMERLREYGRELAAKAPPLPDHLIEKAARIWYEAMKREGRLDELLDRSSLGTPKAKKLRAQGRRPPRMTGVEAEQADWEGHPW